LKRIVDIPYNTLEKIADVLELEVIEILDDFTAMDMYNNIALQRDKYLESLGFHIETDSDNYDTFTIRYHGFIYKISNLALFDLQYEIDRLTNSAIIALLEKIKKLP